MGLRNTGRTTIGPFTVNYGKNAAPSSVSVGIGPARFTVWSRTRRAGLSSLDLPGPYSYRPTRTRKQPRAPQDDPRQPTRLF